ncbi:MAG: 50S ribosomal protein L19 [Candidatus Omnitrophica bacterium]|nr:50S ribosomal protein L19 [Candidatus Omnitrophota bacterium]
MRNSVVEHVESLYMKKTVAEFSVGDTVKVMQRVTEGSKTRLQAFEGVVICRKGVGIRENFTVRRISFGEGVEKTFPVHSSTVESVTRTRQGKVRRSKLYYLRGKSRKEGRIESVYATSKKSDTAEA